MTAKPVTAALARVERNEPGAAEELWALVYQDLKQLASARLHKMQPGQTLQATALVHEAWIRLGGNDRAEWQGRAHFFGAAARSMRNILVDQARRKQRRGGSGESNDDDLPVELVADESAPTVDMLALDEALDAFAEEYDRPVRIVMLRYFAGLSAAEVAELLELSRRTVDRELLFACTWLGRYLQRD